MTIDHIPLVDVCWAKTYRLIRSIFPPIDLFEDIADPADWEALASAEAKSNPRVVDQIGHLALVPVERRVTGPGASYLMAPFVHVSPDRPGRFTDGSYGVYSAGNSDEVAIKEVAHHHGQFMKSTEEPSGWTSQFRMLVGSIDHKLHDVGGEPQALLPDEYQHSQELGAELRAAGSDGVIYPSVRCKGGKCIGIFWPDVMPAPIQSGHYEFHWDGGRVDRIRNCSNGKIFALIED